MASSAYGTEDYDAILILDSGPQRLVVFAKLLNEKGDFEDVDPENKAVPKVRRRTKKLPGKSRKVVDCKEVGEEDKKVSENDTNHQTIL